MGAKDRSAATSSLLREFAEALDKDRGHDKSMVTRTMRDAADEIARLYEELRISYPATPVDCLLSELRECFDLSADGLISRRQFEGRVAEFNKERDG